MEVEDVNLKSESACVIRTNYKSVFERETWEKRFKASYLIDA